MPTLKVAIIGAGPAGCMLARLLQKNPDVQVAVFEADDSADIRRQGGTLDLHPKTGLAALKEGGLYDEFHRHARFDGEALTICDKKLNVCFKISGSADKSQWGRPEIDRTVLRRILLDSLPESVVRWGHKLLRFDDSHILHFQNGHSEGGFDLVVGADGAWSKVRPILTEEPPIYSGVAGHSYSIPNAEVDAPELHKLVNRGSLFAISDGKAIIAQQLGDGSLDISVCARRAENWMDTYDVNDGPSAKQALLEELKDWCPGLTEFVKRGGDDVHPRSLYMLPTGMTWEHRPGVTLVGDAAHLMTQFAGEGVNLAFEDSMNLAHAILEAAKKDGKSDKLDDKIKAFEKDMFKRARRAQQLSDDSMQLLMFTEGAPQSVIQRWMAKMLAYKLHPRVEHIVYPFLLAGIYVFYFVAGFFV